MLGVGVVAFATEDLGTLLEIHRSALPNSAELLQVADHMERKAKRHPEEWSEGSTPSVAA